jgi:hypothetical protein
MACSTDFESQRLAERALEGRRVPRGGPQFELGVAARSELKEVVVSAIVELDARNGLRVTAVEILRETKHRRQRPDGAALPTSERRK